MLPEGKSEQLEQLLRIGRSRGYVLYDEIDKIISPGDRRETAAQLDAIFSELALNSVEVTDDPRTEDSIPDEEFINQAFQNNLEDSAQIRMYLREVLTVSRLTVDEERELSRRIKRGGQGARRGD